MELSLTKWSTSSSLTKNSYFSYFQILIKTFVVNISTFFLLSDMVEKQLHRCIIN